MKHYFLNLWCFLRKCILFRVLRQDLCVLYQLTPSPYCWLASVTVVEDKCPSQVQVSSNWQCHAVLSASRFMKHNRFSKPSANVIVGDFLDTLSSSGSWRRQCENSDYLFMWLSKITCSFSSSSSFASSTTTKWFLLTSASYSFNASTPHWLAW